MEDNKSPLKYSVEDKTRETNSVLLLVYLLYVWYCFFLIYRVMCFLQELKKYGVTTVVRVCEATYDATLVVKEGIQVLVSSRLQTHWLLHASNQTQCGVFFALFLSQLCATFLNTPCQFYACVFTECWVKFSINKRHNRLRPMITLSSQLVPFHSFQHCELMNDLMSFWASRPGRKVFNVLIFKTIVINIYFLISNLKMD